MSFNAYYFHGLLFVENTLTYCVYFQEGDRIGMMRKSNGNLHYFINGLDQDVAAEKVPESVWGVVDLYGTV